MPTATTENIQNSGKKPADDWLTRRNAIFVGLIVLAAVVFFRPLLRVIGSSVSVDQYSQILIVAPISALLIYLERNRIFSTVSYSRVGAAWFVASIGIYVCVAVISHRIGFSTYIALSILLFSACCVAAFLASYGQAASRLALFPLGFLLLMTPWPDALRIRVITFLQHGSAVGTDWFFSLANIPFSRDGVIIVLPSVTIEIAQECSGIRSSLVLVIAGLVLGHLFLKSTWSKVILFLLLIPLTIAKNAFRIFTLSTLGMYVNPSFLSGRLHHQGGIVFFAVSFVALWAMVWALQKLEDKVGTAKN
jgi:exosortase